MERIKPLPCSFCRIERSFFGGTFSGGVDKAGDHLHHCAKLAGFGEKTKLHAVGDGAKWIADQIEE